MAERTIHVCDYAKCGDTIAEGRNLHVKMAVSQTLSGTTWQPETLGEFCSTGCAVNWFREKVGADICDRSN